MGKVIHRSLVVVVVVVVNYLERLCRSMVGDGDGVHQVICLKA